MLDAAALHTDRKAGLLVNGSIVGYKPRPTSAFGKDGRVRVRNTDLVDALRGDYNYNVITRVFLGTENVEDLVEACDDHGVEVDTEARSLATAVRWARTQGFDDVVQEFKAERIEGESFFRQFTVFSRKRKGMVSILQELADRACEINPLSSKAEKLFRLGVQQMSFHGLLIETLKKA